MKVMGVGVRVKVSIEEEKKRKKIRKRKEKVVWESQIEGLFGDGLDRTNSKSQKKFSQNQSHHFYFLYHINQFLLLFK